MLTNFASPLCYTGNKTRLLPLIHENLPQKYQYFVDVFGGSGVCSFSQDHNIIYNEKDIHVYNLIRTLKECNLEFILEKIQSLINRFNLSKDGKNEYIKFRSYFNDTYCLFLNDNKNDTIRHASNLALLVLIFFSYNHYITFNKYEKFMTPSGYKRSSYNKSIKNNLIKFKERLDVTNNILLNLDFRDLFNIYKQKDLTNYLFFIDPIYYISDDNYRRNYGITWVEKDEQALYDMCDEINSLGGKFMITNQLKKGEIVNNILDKFSKKYRVIDTNITFVNSSYQHKRKSDYEIMVLNY